MGFSFSFGSCSCKSCKDILFASYNVENEEPSVRTTQEKVITIKQSIIVPSHAIKESVFNCSFQNDSSENNDNINIYISNGLALN